ncbi:MAG: hypothetical protein AAGK92_02945 [Pseudomonadota bacterium]
MSPERTSPKDISNDLLERTGAAMLSGDFDAFADCFELPQEMDTFHGRNLVETREDLRAIFDAVRQYYRSMGVTGMARHCVEAAYVDPDTVQATHQSRLLAGAELVLTPYPALSVLKQRGGVWRVASCQYAISDAPDLNDALAGRLLDKTSQQTGQMRPHRHQTPSEGEVS